jgi:hypothetical protein
MTTQPNPETTKTSGILPFLMAGALAALVVANGFLFVRMSDIDAQVVTIREQSKTELESFRDQSAKLVADLRGTIESMNQQLAETQTKAAKDTASARTIAQKHAEKLVQSLADQQRLQQEAAAQKFDAAIKETSDQHKAKISAVEQEVGVVKTEVAQTRSTVDATIADLKSVRGDLGVQSGLIATNAQELAALRQLGERNYFEFAITKNQKNVKVGGILLSLKKTDVKRNKYNLEVLADDRRVEKKDKTVNEPVQFYISGARQPMELVVNHVSKDQVQGYLSAPKMMQARR